MNKANFCRKRAQGRAEKKANPNTRVNELKARFGEGYNYRFLEIDNLQREFYYELLRREKEKRRRGQK